MTPARAAASGGLRCLAFAALWSAVVLAAAPAALAQPAQEANWSTLGDFGGTGLLQNRTARFADDGELNVGTMFLEPYTRYYVTLQALPWLEGTFRYTEISNRSFSLGGLESDEDFQDRGADVKVRLWPEGKYLPQVAVGFQDGLGTGLFAGEYLVANKRFYDLDFSAGVGWGYFASGSTVKNPLASVGSSFAQRNADVGRGGKLTFNYFGGETIGLFGGVDWRTPIKGLTAKAEISTQDYQNEPLGNQFKRGLPINVGLVYRPFEWLEVSGAFERGNTAMFRASLRSNLNDAGLPKFDEPPPKLTVRPRKPVDARTSSPGFSLQHRTATLAQPGDPVPVPPSRRGTTPAGPPPDAYEKAADALFMGLSRLDLDIEGVELDADETRIYLANELDRPERAKLRSAARIVSETLQGEGARVRFIAHSASGVVDIKFDREEVEQETIVDHLFDTLEYEGFVVEGIDMSEREVVLYVSDTPDDLDHGERRAASVVLEALPVAAAKVVFVRLEGGAEVSRVALRREDIRREARIERLFDGLETRGFAVESLEIARHAATVYLEGPAQASQQDFEQAARFIATASPEPVDDVVVVGLAAGVEATRVTLRRQGAASEGAAAGADAMTLETDFSDNEKRDIALKVFKELDAQGFSVDAFHISRYKASVFVTPTKFRQHARNVGRVARAMANNLPDSVEALQIITMNGGLETGRITVMRNDVENAVRGQGSTEEIWTNATIEGAGGDGREALALNDDSVILNDTRYPTLNWFVRPAVRTHVGGPEGLLLYQLWLAISAQAELGHGLSVAATVGKNLKSTLDQIELTSDSVLPHVRSDVKEYIQQGADGNIVRLQANYMFQPAPSLFGRVSGGLFEEMFGGVGAEVLYAPFDSRLAFGVDINRVRQRDFDQRFTFRNYEVTTGHFNVYYKLPFFGLVGEIHAGQFLAGDRGAQFVLSREFDSGITFGGWSTFTNVSAEDFGEGSFDKGIYISIPFELMLTNSSRRRGSFAFRPLTRDGGQMLGISPRLYGVVGEGGLDNVVHDWNQFLN